MSVDINRDPAQSTETERREARGERMPFEGIVEVGGALGPSFEAQAVDVSADGMHLRTAYLPELGQPLTCRLELGGDVVLAAGEVVWRQEADRGGEFGMKFTDLDAASEATLRKLLASEPKFGASEGTRVRLHIEGLGAPMRARIKGSAAEGLVVGSELGFLQVGKELELEDAKTGGKRAARIDRVGVEVNPETHIPQLVVSLRYDHADTDQPAEAAAKPGTTEDTPEPSVIDGEEPDAGHGRPSEAPRGRRAATMRAEDVDVEVDPFGPMRSGVGEALHRASAKIGPALARLGAQAKTTIGVVAARAKDAAAKGTEAAPPTRRTTAPPPTGGLHASGRKVVRGEPVSAVEMLDGKQPMPVARRRAAVGSAVVIAGILALVAVRKPAPAPQATPAPEAMASAGASAVSPASAPPPAPAVVTPPAAPATPAAPVLSGPSQDDSSASTVPLATDDSHPHKRVGKVTPFGNGPVGHANVLRLKMDGAIEKIEGATTPTGFSVVIPDRRSLEAAAPLASRDGRIASIRVTNEASGAELAVTFKDGVPNYQVRAKGDSLEILLAPQGKLADAEDAPKPAKHKRKGH